VRVTQEPGVVREIDDAELIDLARQGLIHSYERTEEAKAVLVDTPVGRVKAWKDAEHKADIVTPPPAVTDPPASIDQKGE
jgi:hypothetical protein